MHSKPDYPDRVWIGVASSYAGQSDLHMVLGPNHPTF
jgi:hypothetical protein